MITLEEAEQMLDEIAQELPEEFYSELNGGVLLLPDAKLHPEAVSGDLFILGEYHMDWQMGRYIAIYFGSFQHVYAGMPRTTYRRELRRVLVHEFTHHIESLAGERELDKKDAVSIARYKQRHNRDAGDRPLTRPVKFRIKHPPRDS